jgi:hypothetical protein
MTSLPERNAQLAEKLGRISLSFVVTLVILLALIDLLGLWAILAAAAAALTALGCSVAAMIVRRQCLNPRPSTPPLALLASLVGGGVLTYLSGGMFLFWLSLQGDIGISDTQFKQDLSDWRIVGTSLDTALQLLSKQGFSCEPAFKDNLGESHIKCERWVRKSPRTQSHSVYTIAVGTPATVRSASGYVYNFMS